MVLNTILRFSVLIIAACLAGCATMHYAPLAAAGEEEIQRLKENVYRVEYQVSAITPQDRLDVYVKRRCAELALREGYDYFHLGQRFDVLGLFRRTSVTVTMFKGERPAGSLDLYDARAVLNEQPE